MLAETIYTNSAHQSVIETVNTEKRLSLKVSFSGSFRHMLLDVNDPSSNSPFAELFFLPFQISYRIRIAFNFNKNEGNNQKVENKVSGMVRVGVGRPLLTQ